MASSDAGTAIPRASFLGLPLELRQIIYAYLTPPSRLVTRIRSQDLGVSSVTHRPPPLSLLLANWQIHSEACDVYFRRAVFKIDGLLDPLNVWSLWQIEEVLGATEPGQACLARMRRFELNLFWHALPEGGVAGPTETQGEKGMYTVVCQAEIDRRVERMERVVAVLARSASLRTAVVTWKEVPSASGVVKRGNDWPAKEQVLRPLCGLVGVKLIPGDLVAGRKTEKAVRGLLHDHQKKLEASDGIWSRSFAPHQGSVHDYMELVEKRRPSMTAAPGDYLKKTRSYFD